jgi:hypothetical protein
LLDSINDLTFIDLNKTLVDIDKEQLDVQNLVRVKVNLQVVALNRGDYCALSWVWGKEVNIEDCKVLSRISGLMKTSKKDGKKFIWIDLYCLDQSSPVLIDEIKLCS